MLESREIEIVTRREGRWGFSKVYPWNGVCDSSLLEWPDPALKEKVRDRARFARCTAYSPRLCDDACRVPAEFGARGATAPAREGAGAAAAGGRTARRPAQQRPAQRPPAQQPEQPVRALRGEYCRLAALRRPGGSTRSNFASRALICKIFCRFLNLLSS